MRRIVTALVVLAAASLFLAQARAESKDSQPAKAAKTPAKVHAKDMKSAKVLDKLTSQPELSSDPFSADCFYRYSYRSYYTYPSYYYPTYYPYYTYRTYYTYSPYYYRWYWTY